MYRCSDYLSPFASIPYFLTLVIIGAYFVVRLTHCGGGGGG